MLKRTYTESSENENSESALKVNKVDGNKFNWDAYKNEKSKGSKRLSDGPKPPAAKQLFFEGFADDATGASADSQADTSLPHTL